MEEIGAVSMDYRYVCHISESILRALIELTVDFNREDSAEGVPTGVDHVSQIGSRLDKGVDMKSARVLLHRSLLDELRWRRWPTPGLPVPQHFPVREPPVYRVDKSALYRIPDWQTSFAAH